MACLHYATRAAPPDPLLHHQEHNRLRHVSIGAQDCTTIIISSKRHGAGTSLPKNRMQLPFGAIQREKFGGPLIYAMHEPRFRDQI